MLHMGNQFNLGFRIKKTLSNNSLFSFSLSQNPYDSPIINTSYVPDYYVQVFDLNMHTWLTSLIFYTW